MNLTNEQLRILRHMLGIDTPDDRVPKPYRDYYCAPLGYEPLRELERLGAVSLIPNPCWSGDYYVCTPAGRAAGMASHKTIRNSKAKRIYSKFLDVHECMEDLTFREFLTNPQFAKTRRLA